MNPHQPTAADVSRRSFLKHSTLATASATLAAQLPFVLTSHAAPDDPIRIGVIGCGGRGTGAMADALGAAVKSIYPSAGYHTEDVAEGAKAQAKGVSVVALADVFPDRLTRCREQARKLGFNIPDAHCFTGFNAYRQLLAMPEVNYVLLTTPPHFHPIHLKAAIEAGKHVFMEKPAAVDGAGVRMVLEAGELARQKGLGIAAGSQRRHQRSYNETIKRLQDGMIGDILELRGYWNGGVIWVVDREPGWSDMEWQLRNWNYFTWLSGDHIVEQHVHNLDVCCWVMGDVAPVRAMALGGRQARGGKEHGHIYDHFAVEFEYESGARLFSFTRQMHGTDGKVEEAIVGTKGNSNGQNFVRVRGGQTWRFRETDVNPYHQEHVDLITSIRAGAPINEANNIALSTLAAIMGRESAYSGKTLERDQVLNSPTRLGPAEYKFGDLPFPDIAVPGKYKFA
jgi:predicted dehydrogenase